MKRFQLAAGIVAVFVICLVAWGAVTVVSPLNGGTGVSNPAAHSIMLGEGVSAYTALGPAATGTCLEGTGTSSDPAYLSCSSGGGAGSGFAWGGSGYDGAIVADGSTTIPCLGTAGTHHAISSSYQMVYDCNATTFVVNSGVTIFVTQTRIFAQTSITVNGTIRASATVGGNGANGSGATPGGAGAAPSPDNTAAYFQSPVGCLWSTSTSCSNNVYVSGSSGGAGQSTLAGSNGTNGTAAVGTPTAVVCPSNGVAGKAGGNGGAGSMTAAGTGGTAGSAATCSAIPSSTAALSLPGALDWGLVMGNGTYTSIGYIPSNGDSGGGAGGGGDLTSFGGGGGGSGAKGGNGNQIILSSPTITIGASGVLNANGSNGGNGGNGGNGTGGNCGGGGGGSGGDGGSGGVVVIVAHVYSNAGTVTAAHGTGGSLGSHGAHTGSGSDGVDGVAGANGLDGLVLQIAQ